MVTVRHGRVATGPGARRRERPGEGDRPGRLDPPGQLGRPRWLGRLGWRELLEYAVTIDGAHRDRSLFC